MTECKIYHIASGKEVDDHTIFSTGPGDHKSSGKRDGHRVSEPHTEPGS